MNHFRLFHVYKDEEICFLKKYCIYDYAGLIDWKDKVQKLGMIERARCFAEALTLDEQPKDELALLEEKLNGYGLQTLLAFTKGWTKESAAENCALQFCEEQHDTSAAKATVPILKNTVIQQLPQPAVNATRDTATRGKFKGSDEKVGAASSEKVTLQMSSQQEMLVRKTAKELQANERLKQLAKQTGVELNERFVYSYYDAADWTPTFFGIAVRERQAVLA
jgi:hypothetical protein